MSQPAPNTSLSLAARLLCYIGPPSAILLTAVVSPQTALLSPLACAPPGWFYSKWRKANAVNPTNRGELEPMIWIFAAAGTLGLATAAVTQMGICLAASRVLFGPGSGERSKYFWQEVQRATVDGLTADQISNRAVLASSWQNWVFNGIFAFVSAGIAEETIKYLPIVYARRRGTPKQRELRNRAYLDYVLAGALSFGVVECIGFIYSCCKQENQTWANLALTVFERIVVGQTGHLASATITAFRAIRRDYCGDNLSWLEVVGPAMLLHGLWDFAALSSSALEGNIGFIHPTSLRVTAALFTVIPGVLGAAVWQVRREWKSIESRPAKSPKDN